MSGIEELSVVHVPIVGASTVIGYGDEERRGGFSGRMRNYYEGFGSYNWSADKRGDYTYVFVHPIGIPDNAPPTFAPYFRTNIQQVSEVARRDRALSHFLGIFVLSGVFDPKWIGRWGGAEDVQNSWSEAFDLLAVECKELGVAPVMLTTPAPNGQTRFRNGNPADLLLHRRLMQISRDAAEVMDARFITFEEVVGDNPPDYMAPDGMHPNAAGYTKIAEHLIGLVNHHFRIPYSTDAFPIDQ